MGSGSSAMKRVHKTPATPAQLVAFQQADPDATWEKLRAEGRAVYDELCRTLQTDQGGLCAYCELAATKDANGLQVEHVVAKSYHDPACNWALHWPNMLAVCTGGSRWAADKDRYLEPLPENLSCDQAKNHRVNTGLLSTPAWSGTLTWRHSRSSTAQTPATAFSHTECCGSNSSTACSKHSSWFPCRTAASNS